MTDEIGIISDTHGLIRPELKKALKGVKLIIHAGDIGKEGTLEELREIAPVSAVRGNVDKGAWAGKLYETEVVEAAPGTRIYLIHDIGKLDLDPRAAGFAAVVCGHSHKPSISEKDGVLYLNPGSAGPRRFSLPVTYMRARVSNGAIKARIIDLNK